MKKILHKISLILFNVIAVVFGLSIVFTEVCKTPDISNILLGQPTVETITSGKEPVYFKSWYQSVEDVLAGSGDFAKAAEAEGAVLLKNELLNGSTTKRALPLDKTQDKVSLFGVTAYDPMYSLNGAGAVGVNQDRKQFFFEEFEKVGLDVNEDLAAWYNSNTQYRRNKPSQFHNANLNGASWDNINTEAKTKSGYKTAVFVIGRLANEGSDLPPYSTDKGGTTGLTDGDYLKLTSIEKNLLAGLKSAKDNGHFDRIIVLINAANPIMDDFIDNAAYGIDAAMWIGFPGTNGIAAVADLMVNNSNPSGKMTTTWYSSRTEHPSWNNFGRSNGSYSVIYQEGVYVGYKYAETRYEDYVMEVANAGTFDYDKAINYTFGHGLSYTTFSQEFISVEQDNNPEKNYDYKGDLLPASERRKAGDDLIAKVKVTNTGTVAGKEVVQIYLQQPYTASNKTNGVEKPSVELVGFAKTKKLAVGESQTVEVKIDANKFFAAYDKVANTYVVDAGTYYLTTAQDAHNAVNNVLLAKNITSNKMIGTGNKNLVKTVAVSQDYANNYEYWTLGEEKVTNLFDHADPNTIDPNGNHIIFMSRSDWANTVLSTSQKVTETTLRKKGKTLDNNGDFSNAKTNYAQTVADLGDEYPTYGKQLDEHLDLVDMRGVEYDVNRGATAEDIQKWEDFLDQLTWAETLDVVGRGRRMTYEIESIGKPRTNDVNASNGISWRFDMTPGDGGQNKKMGFGAKFDPDNRNHYPVGYPCEGIVAASFNKDIAYVIGQSIGEDALWAGASGLYGFGLNLHRNPYHGRAGEYYSEDAFLTGIIAGWSSKGAWEKGLYVYNKHFVLNDQEIDRSSYSTWITEQALRQAHIRPFEMAIEIGDAMCVMTAFSRIGTYWSGNDYNLMTRCLRGELGMRGFAVTDWYKSSGMGMRNGILAGQDLPDGTSTSEFDGYGPENGGHGYLAQAMRRSAQKILYTVANSNAMNFFGDDTRVITHNPASYAIRDKVISGVNIAFYSSTALAVGASVWMIVDAILKKKKI